VFLVFLCRLHRGEEGEKKKTQANDEAFSEYCIVFNAVFSFHIIIKK